MKLPDTFSSARNTRRVSKSIVGRFRAGKLNPVMCVAVRGNEGGMLSQSCTIQLDPIAGRLDTPITGEAVMVFVPVQAVDAIIDPDAAYAGMTEVVREKLLTGNPLFPLENETEISRRCGVNPRSVGGTKKVLSAVRYGHNAAVNYLRQRKYHKATLVPYNNITISPAILMETVLDRLNGVLDPDDRINGSVELQLPTLRLPVEGIGFVQDPAVALLARRETGETETEFPQNTATLTSGNLSFGIDVVGAVGQRHPNIHAILNGSTAGNVSLSDFYNAERMDQLVRIMRKIVEDNPEYGDEMVLRWVHNLSVDSGKTPFVLSERREIFGRQIVGATDSAGIAADTMRSDMALKIDITVPIPKTELGGFIYTFLVVRPDETLDNQPDPILSDVWGLDNFVADELALDPVPVTMRDLDANVTAANESTVAFYTGLNALKATYVTYGLARNLNPAQVDHKNALWQIKLPMSVTPDNILYPADLDHYPFADQAAQVCRYNIVSQATISTPMIFGPTPVETLAVIDSENLFEE